MPPLLAFAFLRAVFVAALFCAAAAARGEDGGEDRRGGVSLTAAELRAQGENYFARDAEAQAESLTLRAGRVEYDAQSGVLRAADGFVLTLSAAVFEGASLFYERNEARGEAGAFRGRLRNSPWRVEGGGAQWRDEGWLNVRAPSLTTCPVEDEDWRIIAQSAEINRADNEVVFHHARLELGGVPVMYIPRAALPLDGRRKKSGFLPPLARSLDGDLDIQTPVYFFLAENYDATFSPRYISARGVLAEGEARWLTAHSGGQIQAGGSLGRDKKFGKSRHYWRARHQSRPDEVRRFLFESAGAGDNDYFKDFSDETEEVAERHLQTRAFAEYQYERWRFAFDARRFQTLGDARIAARDILPAAFVNYRRRWGASAFVADLAAARFADGGNPAHDGDVTRINGGAHFEAWRRLAGGLRLGARAGARGARYYLTKSRTAGFAVPFGEVEGKWRFFGGAAGGVHELRLLYARSRFRRQGGAPLLDTADAALNAESVFEWNRFTGGDRAADADFLAYGWQSRWMRRAGAQSRDALRLRLGQRRRFQKPRVAAVDRADNVSDGKFSNLFAAVYAAPYGVEEDSLWAGWSLAGAADFNPENGDLPRADFRIQRQFAAGDIGAGYLKDSQSGERINAGGHWRGARADFSAEAEYALASRRWQDAALALTIKDECNCWQVELGVRRLLQDARRDRNEISLRVQLVGLGI